MTKNQISLQNKLTARHSCAGGEKIQQTIEHSLHERVKELGCLYNVINSIMDRELTIEKIFQDIVCYLPPSWQYPDIACARIVFMGQEYVSADFKTSIWKQSADIFSEGERVGAIEVYYLKKMPDIDEGPFLKGERHLIDAVANHVANACKRIRLERSLKERLKELRCFYGVSNVIEKYHNDQRKTLQGIVDLLPGAWQYPEITCAKIILNNEEFKTDNHKSSPWSQISDIKIGHQVIGVIEVNYTQKMSVLDKDLFLKEEQFLINALAERIGSAIARIRAEEELETERISLKNKNIALKEIVERIQEEKKEMAEKIHANMDKLVMPLFSVLEKNADQKHTGIIKLLKKNLEEIVSPFTRTISKEFASLSPVEIQICNYIKNGFSTKDIAQLRGIAIATVSRHREHIRRKLKLTNKNINFVTYLNSFMTEKELGVIHQKG